MNSKHDDWGGRGENNRRAKLTEDRVREIKRLLHQGMAQKDIAARFGLARSVVSDIKNGRLWFHVRV